MTRPLFFATHLAEARLGYWQHLRYAWRVARIACTAGLAAAVHGLVPSLFERTASRLLLGLSIDIQAAAAGRPLERQDPRLQLQPGERPH